MRKQQKRQAEELLARMELAHEQIRKELEKKKLSAVAEMLEICQNLAIDLGTLIENAEGGGVNPTVTLLEEYCELVYGIHEEVAAGKEPVGSKTHKILKQKLIKIFNSFHAEIKIRLEAVFLPYQVSMWDSMESVWEAAEADPDCDAYVIPIPYFERKPDGSPEKWFDDSDKYPSHVPITGYSEFDFAAHRPDMIFIHNPYDGMNSITSIHPFFYSDHIKQFTECLVYIPYYASMGSIGVENAICPVYEHADYIVIQAEKFREYYGGSVPDEKFLVLGSPKFDKVIQKCQNPPEPPEAWKEKMNGRKVYFYNTSVNSLLFGPEDFLKKMKYVFQVFQGRKDACLLWRPHPLMDSTFRTKQAKYWSTYESLKQQFIEEDIGILDETPDIENTIALSDVYVGDGATSVTSLFGVAGKPLFMLDNGIHSLPEKDDWKRRRLPLQFHWYGDDRYQVTHNNHLWFSENNDYQYRFYMNLNMDGAVPGQYLRALEIDGKIYVLPRTAQHLLVIENKTIRKIEFPYFDIEEQAFVSVNYFKDNRYIFLIPHSYPFLIRYQLDVGKIDYIEDIQPFYVRMTEGGMQRGGVGFYDNNLLFASPEDGRILFLDMDTLERTEYNVPAMQERGIQGFSRCGQEEELWLIPMRGFTIVRWNPQTGEMREYGNVPEQFRVVRDDPLAEERREHPFEGISFFEENGRKLVVISPRWGNMFLSLDTETGETKEWNFPMRPADCEENDSFQTGGRGCFVITRPQAGKAECKVWFASERRLYEMNAFTGTYREVEVDFAYEDLVKLEPGFYEMAEDLPYCLCENRFNSLQDLLDGKIAGNPFDRERQLRAFSKLNADTEGACGQKIYACVKGRSL